MVELLFALASLAFGIRALAEPLRVVGEGINEYFDKRRQHEFRTQALNSNKRIVEVLSDGNCKAIESDVPPGPKRRRKKDEDG